VTIRVRAPATSANLGPGFDSAGVALELWNELEVGQGDDSVDESHLGIQAFARFASPRGRTFAFTDRIPRERGLGSSAAVVALGLVAGALAAGSKPSAEELLAAGLELEGHPDNLAPALVGGVCLTWEGRIARIADTVPAVPIALVPPNRVRTSEARSALPASIAHADAAFTVGRAALLGASLAGGDETLFAAALGDRLHEPYRSPAAPALAEVRGDLPEGALGATLSGSGPTVIVWAMAAGVEPCAAELRRRYPHHEVWQLAVAANGAGPF
jgi:homoserine kinase